MARIDKQACFGRLRRKVENLESDKRVLEDVVAMLRKDNEKLHREVLDMLLKRGKTS